MKEEIRVIGIDDSPFERDNPLDLEVMVVGTIYRGGKFLDGLVSTYVERDGDDATVKLIGMINNCKFKPQLQAILLDGIAVAGFNVININALNEKTGLPVVVVVSENPDFEKLDEALKSLGMGNKAELVGKMMKPVKINDVYAQFVGMDEDEARELLQICSPRSNVPEALRVAHIIASGLVKGESSGGA